MPGHAGGAPGQAGQGVPGRAPTLEADTESPQKLKCLPQARKALSALFSECRSYLAPAGLRLLLGSGCELGADLDQAGEQGL